MRLFLRPLPVAALVSLLVATLIVLGPAQASVPNTTVLANVLPPPAIYAVYDKLVVLNPANGDVERTGPELPFNRTSAMLASPNRARVYLFAFLGTEIAVVSSRSLQTLTTIAVPQGFLESLGTGWLAISPNGNLIYTVDAAGDGIVIISTQLNSVVKFVPMGDTVGGVTVGDDGKRVYVSLPNQNRIAVLDPSGDKVIDTIFEGPCTFGFRHERCDASGLITSGDGRYVVGLSGGTASVVGIDSTTNQIVGKSGINYSYPNHLRFIGANAAANQVTIWVEKSPSGHHTVFISTDPPFGWVSYAFPVGQFDSAFTAAFDPTGTIGYACGDTRMGPVVQFTTQSYQFLNDLGVPNALVLVP